MVAKHFQAQIIVLVPSARIKSDSKVLFVFWPEALLATYVCVAQTYVDLWVLQLVCFPEALLTFYLFPTSSPRRYKSTSSLFQNTDTLHISTSPLSTATICIPATTSTTTSPPPPPPPHLHHHSPHTYIRGKEERETLEKERGSGRRERSALVGLMFFIFKQNPQIERRRRWWVLMFLAVVERRRRW
ncbi:hypothetical protein HanRHA438_Chr08g0356421 [Helianthus annuus]|nr:hypothetical protein HanRHA438_Chr08g0356421 [Helianthus annuus]